MSKKPVVSLSVAVLLSGVLVMNGCSMFYPDPPRPEITYGEFPFRLEYEINGKRVIVEDTVICKFDGIGWNEGWGKYRKWVEYLASNNKEDSVLLMIVDSKTKLYYTTGSARYYMGDWEPGMYNPEYTIVRYDAFFATNWGLSGWVPKDELSNKYGIKIISFEPSEPIVNTFK